MRTLPLCLACVALSLLAGCAEPNPTEIWDVRATPSVCVNDEGDNYYCASYNVVGTDESSSFYESVDGFEPAWGRTYQIEVERIGEGGTATYELVEILAEEFEPELEFDIELLFDWVNVGADGGTIEQHDFTCTPDQCTELSALRSALELDQHIDATFRFGPAEQLFPLELVSFELVEG